MMRPCWFCAAAEWLFVILIMAMGAAFILIVGLALLLRWLAVPLIICALLLVGIACVGAEELIEPTPQEAADIATWIPSQCCRTNNCCRKVPESALIQLPNNDVRVVTTGQVLKRTGWSQDGQTWRCTCDPIDGKWVVHPNANTRCVFPVPAGS